jgi:hypothetical protein
MMVRHKSWLGNDKAPLDPLSGLNSLATKPCKNSSSTTLALSCTPKAFYLKAQGCELCELPWVA